MTTEVGVIFSVEELLARSKAAVGSSAAGQSKVQKLLAQNGEGITDTVNLSPVARLLRGTAEANPKRESYFESDAFINAKVAQLRGQIELYSNLPGLDPTGAMLDSLTEEVNALVTSQQKKIKDANDEIQKKQAELAAADKARADAPLAADEMLKRVKGQVSGTPVAAELSKEVQAMLDKVKKGTVVNTSA